MDWQETLSFVLEIARDAGTLLLNGQQKIVNTLQKSSAIDLVTEYDQASEALILTRLRERFPDHTIHAEESGTSEQDSPYTWIIDPLDGTTNFTHGFPHYSVSIALYEMGQPLLGVVYDPTRDECFYAWRGQGAYLKKNGQPPIQLHVTQRDQLVQSLLGTGFPYDRHSSDHNNWVELGAFLRKGQGIRRAGSAALDMAYVAIGRLDGYWEYKLNSWDIAAGVLLVQEAGGHVTLIDGTTFAIAPRLALIASNGKIHTQMVEVLRPFVLTH